jgi:hypothetical protein
MEQCELLAGSARIASSATPSGTTDGALFFVLEQQLRQYAVVE